MMADKGKLEKKWRADWSSGEIEREEKERETPFDEQVIKWEKETGLTSRWLMRLEKGISVKTEKEWGISSHQI